MIIAARRHLFLSGFMGTGKSTIGRLVAERTSHPFYDLDTLVEQASGRTVSEVFAIEGEAAFRHHEYRALRSIVGASASIIALGGGALMTPGLRKLVLVSGRTVLLTADTATIWRRVQDEPTRPKLHDESGNPPVTLAEFASRAERIMESRREVYTAAADWTLDTSTSTPETAAKSIVEWWSGHER